MSLQGKSGPLLVRVNKVLSEPAAAIHVYMVHGCFHLQQQR